MGVIPFLLRATTTTHDFHALTPLPRGSVAILLHATAVPPTRRNTWNTYLRHVTLIINMVYVFHAVTPSSRGHVSFASPARRQKNRDSIVRIASVHLPCFCS